MYIYESHLGQGFYTSDWEIPWDERHCEICGDSDWPMGEASTRAEAWELLKSVTSINGSGGYDCDYVQSFINENFPE